MWAVMTIAAMGLNLTLGYAGQVSLAQGAFVGIGAYTLALIMTQAGVPLTRWRFVRRHRVVLRHRLAARLSGAARAASLSRFRHARLHDARLSGLAQRGMADRRHLRHLHHPAPGSSSAMTTRQGDAILLSSASASLVVISLAVWWMMRSPWGRAFMALRENPVRALVARPRYPALYADGLRASARRLAAVAGALFASLVQYHRAGVVRADRCRLDLLDDGDRRRLRLLLGAVRRRD